MNIMKAGDHEVKVKNYGIFEDKNSNAKPFIEFTNREKEVITWYGNLTSEKSTEYVIKALLNAGFIGNDFADLAKPNMFKDKISVIRVGDHEYDGKTQTRVNAIFGEKKEMKSMSADEAAAKITKAQGKFMDLRNKLGMEQPTSSYDNLPNAANLDF